MATSTPPKKNKRTRDQMLAQVDTRNRSGLGWQVEDFGMMGTALPISPSAPPGLAGTTYQAQTKLPKLTSQLPSNTPASQVLTPAEQQRVRTYINNPEELGIVAKGANATATFLSKLFDTEDTKENVLESIWDYSLKGLNWPNDQVNHLTAALISVMPGGMQTLSWDDAQKLSTGQAFVSDAGIRAGNVRRGENMLAEVAGALPFAPLQAIGIGAAQLSPDSPIQQEGFDPLSPEGRKAFESGPEKFFSGLTDFGMVFADPLLIVGWAGKIGRLKYIDRLILTDADRARVADEIATHYTAPEGKAAPIAQTLKAWTDVDSTTGEKLVTQQEIYDHPLIRRATNREQLASALYNARDVQVADILDPTNVAKQKSMSGYDLAGLILRWGYGDEAAGAQLASMRADMADALAQADRSRIGLMYALNPGVADRAVTVAEAAMKKASREIRRLEARGLRNTEEWNTAVKARDIAEDTVLDLQRGNFDVLQSATPEAEALAARVWKDLVANDKALQSALGRDPANFEGVKYSLTQSTKGFAADNRLGRAIEARRRRVAKATTQAASTRGARMGTGEMMVTKDGIQVEKMRRLAPWQADTYGNGFTRDVNVWRRASAEAPAGFIITKGIGAQESGREIRAVFNEIRMYSGAARRVILKDGEPPVLVGGTARKEQLLQMYNEALASTSAESADAAAIALRQIEEMVFKDISAYYGISKENAEILQRQAFRRRDKLMGDLSDENRAFWIDENGKFNKIEDEWLDSQVQNSSGTFMLNYREFERLADMANKSGLSRALGEGTAFVGRNVGVLLDWFNDIWRPLVLMRLGYTLRNNVEGQFRAWAFTGSLDPFTAAVTNAGYSAKTLFGHMAGYRKMDRAAAQVRIDKARASGRPLPKKYEKWLKAQVNGVMRQIADSQAFIDSQLVQLAEYSPEIRRWGLDWYSKTISKLSADSATARTAGRVDEADLIDNTITQMMRNMDSVNNIRTFQPTFTNDAVRAFDELKFNDMVLDAGYRKLTSLDDEATALMLFYRQGAARARAYSGTIETPSSRTLYQAFNPDNPFTPPALGLLSGDSTFKSMLAGRASAVEATLRVRRTTNYEAVKPGEKLYWDGLANMLQQVRFSGIGSRIMRGQTDDQIIEFLLKEQDGIETLRYLTGNTGRLPNGTRDQAQFFVEQARARYETLTPTPELRSYVESLPDGIPIEAAALKNVFKGQDSDLYTVVGKQIEDFGFKNPMQVWRGATAFGMKWLGTVPEDTFVRSPFYGARYQKTVEELVRIRMGQPGDVSMRELTFIQQQAHRRALKDTKDWLYTIDRPTLLGRVGETSVPFISAAQNSMTTFGRLIYNNPAVAVVLVDLWRAPTKAGFEDEEGNIVLPIPHDFIPDVIEKATGLESMANIKFNKSQLNVIVPESGFGFIPRPGPVVAVPVSEFMKRGLFGQTVESPEILRTLLGGKEQADQFWTVYKNYIFGEGQGVAPDAMSLSLFAPPVAQKIIQIIQGNDSPQFGYWYNTILRSEWAKWSAGMRETQPDPNDILNQTRGFQMLRLAANLFAFTPPQYESIMDPLVQTVRYYDRTQPEDSNRIINEKFGPVLQMLGDFKNSKNNAGMLPYADSVEMARKYSDIIGQTAPTLERIGDLSVIAMITAGNANQYYDDSAYGWQYANIIPGTNRTYREMQAPAQSWVQSSVNAGWSTYLRAEDQFQARLRQSGATSYRQNKPLAQERAQFIKDLGNNPLFSDWYRDYRDFGSSRTQSAVYMMESVLNNERFMQDQADNQIWQVAPLYLEARNTTLAWLAERGGSIDAQKNADIRAYWDGVRADLAGYSTQWASFSNRWLNGDDDPEEPGVTFANAEVTV